MRYMRCKCGRHECWTSMGSPDCSGCDECRTTLAEAPDEHRPIAPHDWREEWKAGPAEAAPAKERVCLRCMKHEDITEANADAVHIVVDGGAIWMPTNKTTGKDIKVAARIDPAFKLWVEGGPEWAAKGGDETPIGDDDIVGLVEGVRFMSVPPGVF